MYKEYGRLLMKKHKQTLSPSNNVLRAIIKELKRGKLSIESLDPSHISIPPNVLSIEQDQEPVAWAVQETPLQYHNQYRVLIEHYQEGTLMPKMLSAYYYHHTDDMRKHIRYVTDQGLLFLTAFYELFLDVIDIDEASFDEKISVIDEHLEYLDFPSVIAYFYLKACIAFKQMAYRECVSLLKLIKPLMNHLPMVQTLVSHLELKLNMAFNGESISLLSSNPTLKINHFDSCFIRHQEILFLQALNQLDASNLPSFFWIDYLDIKQIPKALISLVVHLKVEYHDLLNKPLKEVYLAQVNLGYKDAHYYKVLLRFARHSAYEKRIESYFEHAQGPYLLEKALFQHRHFNHEAMLEQIKTYLFPLACKYERPEWMAYFEHTLIDDAIKRRRYKEVHTIKSKREDLLKVLEKL